MTSPPRLVIITGDGPEHRYVANRLCQAFDVAAILVADPPARRGAKAALRHGVGHFIDKLLWRGLLYVTLDAQWREREVEAVLGELSRDFLEPERLIRVGRPKAGSLFQEVDRLAPDHLAIYGTGIIPDSVLNRAQLALNMHTGISPFYRGASCAFWPIHEGQPEMIGATVHECTSQVDGGMIYATSRADLRRGDDLHAIFARAVLAGADAYVAVLRAAVDGRLDGVKQNLTQGREYKGRMRGFRAEIAARWRLRGMRRGWSEDSRST